MTVLNDLSILIVSWNGAGMLKGCLMSIRSVLGNVDVVVVDNGSTDDARAVCETYGVSVCVRSEKNLGFAGGNNLGLPHCRGRFILLLNNDTISRSAQSVTQLADYLRTHPEVGVAQAKLVLSRQGDVLDACGEFLTPFGFLYHYGYCKPDGALYQKPYPVFAAKAACVLIRREAITAAGGFLFHDRFGSYYEDIDFCHRVWLGGYEIWFVPGEPVEHLQGATSDRLGFDAVWRQYLTNILFSFSTLLGGYGAIRILPGFAWLYCASAIFALIRRRWRFAWIHVSVFGRLLLRIPEIRSERKRLKPFKKVSEKKVFSKTLKWPGWCYFLHSARGDLKNYRDAGFE